MSRVPYQNLSDSESVRNSKSVEDTENGDKLKIVKTYEDVPTEEKKLEILSSEGPSHFMSLNSENLTSFLNLTLPASPKRKPLFREPALSLVEAPSMWSPLFFNSPFILPSTFQTDRFQERERDRSPHRNSPRNISRRSYKSQFYHDPLKGVRILRARLSSVSRKQIKLEAEYAKISQQIKELFQEFQDNQKMVHDHHQLMKQQLLKLRNRFEAEIAENRKSLFVSQRELRDKTYRLQKQFDREITEIQNEREDLFMKQNNLLNQIKTFGDENRNLHNALNSERQKLRRCRQLDFHRCDLQEDLKQKRKITRKKGCKSKSSIPEEFSLALCSRMPSSTDISDKETPQDEGLKLLQSKITSSKATTIPFVEIENNVNWNESSNNTIEKTENSMNDSENHSNRGKREKYNFPATIPWNFRSLEEEMISKIANTSKKGNQNVSDKSIWITKDSLTDMRTFNKPTLLSTKTDADFPLQEIRNNTKTNGNPTSNEMVIIPMPESAKNLASMSGGNFEISSDKHKANLCGHIFAKGMKCSRYQKIMIFSLAVIICVLLGTLLPTPW